MKERILFAFFAVLLIFNFPTISQAQVLRPDLMYCGGSDRNGADLYLGIGSFNEISGCVPDDNTQALLIAAASDIEIAGNRVAWLAYLNAGGVIISSKSRTNEIYNELFETGYQDTVLFGVCENNAMPSLRFNPLTEQFWVDNPGLVASPADTSCGSDNAVIVAGEPAVTALGGMVDTDPQIVTFAERPQGAGVFWLLEADWAGNTHIVTVHSKNFMGALIANGADVSSFIFEDGFESE